MRLIDADDLLKKKREMELYFAVPEWEIEKAPTIDAVPVVRCKDCKFFQYGDYCCGDKMEHSHAREDDFCSYGERKDGEG